MENDENSKELEPYKDSAQERRPIEKPNDNTMTVAVVSLIFGILSCAGNAAWGWGSMVCLLLGTVGILMAISANKKRTTTPGILGVIFSLIGLLISGLGTACMICATTGVGAIVSCAACGIIKCVQ